MGGNVAGVSQPVEDGLPWSMYGLMLGVNPRVQGCEKAQGLAVFGVDADGDLWRIASPFLRWFGAAWEHHALPQSISR